jgi:serine/threonine protein phosphatase 1
MKVPNAMPETALKRDPIVPPGSCVYAIGDIHGRADLLEVLHRKICEDAASRRAKRRVVVYLGDYIDRGSGSRQVIDLLLDRPLPGFEAMHLLGNHEDSLLRFLDDTVAGPPWLFYGGEATVASYGINPAAQLPAGEDPILRMQTELRRRLPPRHLEFLKGLKLMHVEGDYLFVHAGIRPGVPLDRQKPEDLLWIRREFLTSTIDHGRVVVHGHSISTWPENRANRIGIDTGAFASDRLTCLVLEGKARSFLQS